MLQRHACLCARACACVRMCVCACVRSLLYRCVCPDQRVCLCVHACRPACFPSHLLSSPSLDAHSFPQHRTPTGREHNDDVMRTWSRHIRHNQGTPRTPMSPTGLHSADRASFNVVVKSVSSPYVVVKVVFVKTVISNL